MAEVVPIPRAIRQALAADSRSRASAAVPPNFNAAVARYEAGLALAARRLYMHPKWLRYQLRRTRESYLPALRRERSKGTVRIVAEMATLALAWRCLPFHYLRYGLFRRGVTRERAMSFLPETVMYYAVLPRINRMSALLDDKLVFKQVLAADGIPHPRTLLTLRRGGLYRGDRPLGLSEAADLLRQDSAARLIAKPARFGSSGKRIVVFERQQGEYRSDGRHLAAYLDELVREGDWLVEEHLEQAEETAAPHPPSTNTVRVITWFHRTSGPEVLYTMLKTGAGGRPTDNAHTDGLYVRVQEDGALDETAWDEQLRAHAVHPDTGFRFAAGRLPAIEAVRETAVRCAHAFPEVTFAGWDIAVTPGGPAVIEGNSSPGLTIIQRTYGGMAPVILRCLQAR